MYFVYFINYFCLLIFGFSARMGPANGTAEPPVTSPRHSIHHSDSIRGKPIIADHSRSLSNANDLGKGTPVRPYFNDSPHSRNVGK